MINRHTGLGKIKKLVHPCRCKRCEHPCRYGSGAFADGQIAQLAEYLDMEPAEVIEQYLEKITKFSTTKLRPKLLREEGKPYGKCIFYEEGIGCKIHAVKPLECKIAMGCKPYGSELITWFMLNHYLNEDDPESLREFKIYLESGGETLPGAEFEDVFDEETLKSLEEYEDIKDDTDWEEVLGL